MRAISKLALLAASFSLSACVAMVDPVDPVASSGGTDYSKDYVEDNRVWGPGLGEPQLRGEDLDAALATSETYPLGSLDNPVRVNRPAGERAYLARLRCSDGRRPDFVRVGNVGIGVYGNVIDRYDVNCHSAAPGRVDIYMDMYFNGAGEQRAVPGFTITK